MVVTFSVASERYFPVERASFGMGGWCGRQVRILSVLVVSEPLHRTVVTFLTHFHVNARIADIAEVPGGYVLYKKQQYGIALLSTGGE